VQTSIQRALVPLLEPGEELRACSAVWMADRRPRVPLLFTSRAVYLLALTDQRLLVFDTPRRGRPVLEADLLLAKPHDSFTLRRVSRLLPMLQLRVSMGARELVMEFRPRDRATGREVAAALRAAHRGARPRATDEPAGAER
jgi:hypothetical protein